MEVIVCYIVIYFVEALIIWLYCNDLFTAKYSVRRTFAALSLCYSLLFFLSLLNLYWLNALAVLIANFIFIYFMYDSQWSAALFHAGITTMAMGSGELFILSLHSDFARHFYEARAEGNSLIIFSFISKLIYFFIALVLSRFFAFNSKKTTGSQGSLVLIPVPLASFFVMITFSFICHTTDISAFHGRMIAVSSVLLLLLNLLIWFFFSLTQKRNEEFTELQLSLVKENDLAEYYKMLSAQNENRSILIHDIRNNLYTISNLANQNQSAEIVDYIDKLVQTSSLQSSDSLQICKNTTLNAILCRYKEECKKQDISFIIDSLDNSLDFMNTNDLTALFCNLLDNAVEAAACVPDSFIKLNISKQENTPFAVLFVQNSCPQNPIDTFGKLPSHKKDASRHGFGMKSIQRTIDNYGGEMEFYYEEKTRAFCVVIRISV